MSKEIWQYLLKRKITITVEYSPGSMNVGRQGNQANHGFKQMETKPKQP